MKLIKAEDDTPEVRHVNYIEVKAKENNTWGPRRINEYELILVLQGEFEFINHDTNERIIQKAGTILLIFPEELHTYRLRPEQHHDAFFSCIHLELKPDIDRTKEVWDSIPSPRRLTPVAGNAEIVSLFKQTDAENQRNSRYKDTILSLIAKQIWIHLSEKWLEPEGCKASSRIEEMLQYLREHRLKHPGRNELAAKFRLSPQHINLIFKKELGIPPIRFVHRELIRDAYRLLLENQLSVKETAEQLGFSNQFYFSRVFKKEMGFPPGLRK